MPRPSALRTIGNRGRRVGRKTTTRPTSRNTGMVQVDSGKRGMPAPVKGKLLGPPTTLPGRRVGPGAGPGRRVGPPTKITIGGTTQRSVPSAGRDADGAMDRARARLSRRRG